MIGQGSPLSRHRSYAALAWPGWLRCGVTLAVISCTTAAVAAESTLRLRIAWGGGAEHQWQGAVRLSQGTLSEVQPLGIEADEPGSIWIDSSEAGGTVLVRERSPRAYDGLDLLVTAELDARLVIELEAVDLQSAADDPRPAEAPTKSLELALKDLITESHKTQLDSSGNRLLVMRSPGDRVRVQFERDTLVFSPREPFPLEIQPHLLGLPAGTAIHIKAQLTPVHLARAPLKDRLWTKEFDLVTPEADEESPSKALEVKLPEVEGVYDLMIAVIDGRLTERFPWKKPLADRKVQLVVLDEKRSADESNASPAMSKVLEIDPANPRWFDRFANLPLVPGQRRGPLGSGAAVRWEHHTLGPMIRLGGIEVAKESAPDEEEVAWESYPLPITDPGQPHVLEVEYPSDVPQMLGISIIEPNAAGAVMPIGLDSGVYVGKEQADDPPALRKHRVVFWPRTKSPLLLITNRQDRTPAVYGKIRILGTPQTQLAVLGIGQRAASHVTLPRVGDASRFLAHNPSPELSSGGHGGKTPRLQGRLFAGYLDRPLFVENFSAPEAIDLFSRRSLDDWATFYLGSQRLVEYLNHVGYNGLVMSVLADGSTIYPSSRLEPTPKHDTGVFFAAGQDPIRKDVLEVVFRMFDREGLTLIPAVQFAAPLAELEALKRQSPAQAVGIDLVGADGRSWSERAAPNQGLAPYYNPLHPRVQEAMLGVVRELAERYGEHPSFGGLAVQLTADGYSQLPGPDWGYDDETVARFVHDARIDAREAKRLLADDSKRFGMRAELLGGTLKPAWLEWRAEQLVSLHRRMQEAVQGNLVLLGGSLFESSTALRGLRPALPRRTQIDDVLLSFGLRPQAYAAGSGVIFVRPYRIGPPQVESLRGVDAELNLAPDVDQLFATTAGSSAALFHHEPVRTRVESFDEQSPFGKANTYTWLISQFSPSGDRNRRRFVHSVAVQDAQSLFDGGWLMPLGQEDALGDFVSTYRQLPAAAFLPLKEPSEPVTIRTLTREGQTYVYFANDAPWRVRMQIAVEAPAAVRVERLGPARKLPPLLRESGGTANWTLDLQPFELVAAKFAAPNVRFVRPRVTLDEAVRAALTKRIGDLSTRVAALANPMPLPILTNPGFEAPVAGDQIPGWTLGKLANTAGVVDADLQRGGKQSLRLTSGGARASVRSATLDPPTTGRLSVSLWLKIADNNRQPVVRLAVEGRIDGADYYRFAAVGGTGLGQVALAENWAQYIYQVDDLPGKGVSDLRVRFDLMGAGEVWIDDVQVFDLSFSESERVELSKLVSLAEYKRSVGEYAGCLQLLDSFWPQFLVEHVPLSQGVGPLVRRPAPPRKPLHPNPPVEEPKTEEPKKPGVFERLRGFVPRFSSE